LWEEDIGVAKLWVEGDEIYEEEYGTTSWVGKGTTSVLEVWVEACWYGEWRAKGKMVSWNFTSLETKTDLDWRS
jgi:hypothetical protein